MFHFFEAWLTLASCLAYFIESSLATDCVIMYLALKIDHNWNVNVGIKNMDKKNTAAFNSFKVYLTKKLHRNSLKHKQRENIY